MESKHKIIFSFTFLFLLLMLFSSATKPMANLPPARGYKTTKPLIYIDPGHGGLDHGAVIKKPYLEEKRLCLTTAHYTKRHLEQLGYRVSLTRSRDFFVPLHKRASIANRSKAGIYLCIHFNSCPNSSAHGIEIYYFDKNNQRSINSKKLAQNVLNKTSSKTKAKSRGVKKGNFYVIKETKMPSILIEAGFLTNPKERSNILNRQYLDKIARGIAEGVDSFVKT